MGFERYVEYALDVPMYFVFRDGKYIDARGQSFRDFMAGKLPAVPGQKPTIGDFADHLTTLFPDVRLKKFLEQRGADGGPWKRICALPALWVGLLYDDGVMDAAWDLVSSWTAGDRQTLRMTVPRQGLHTLVPRDDQRMLSELANEILALSRAGLDRRGHKDSKGRTEAHFLDELQDIVDAKASPARQALRRFEEEWDGDITRVYRELDD
jgi:glutamate--cysteine ligase